MRILISIFLLKSFLLSQAMYVDNNRNVYSVNSYYFEGENKSWDYLNQNSQNSFHEYGIGFSSVLNGRHEISIYSRKNNIDFRTWQGFISKYDFHIKPKSPVKYLFGTSFSRLKNKNDNLDEYSLIFGLYGDIKGSKSTGLAYYPFLNIGKQREILNFDNSDDNSTSYDIATLGVSFMFKDSKNTGVGIEPSYSRITYDKGDVPCSSKDCDYYFISLKIYLWEYGSYKPRK